MSLQPEKRRVCVATGSRAEYGLLVPTLEALRDAGDFDLQLLVTGAHLSPIYGNTIEAIEADGFVVDAAVDMGLAASTPVAITKSVGLGMIGIADALQALKPDIIVVLGDRYEMLAVGSAALFQRIPIAHIHGGEVTAGAFDEAIRHSLTKMAHLHLVAADQFATRVRQLGENPDTIKVVGAPGLENLRRMEPLSRQELEADLGITLSDTTFLITFHPVTLEKRTPRNSIDALLDALSAFPDASMIFTGANADTRSDVIYDRVSQFVNGRKDKAVLVSNLGQKRYLSAMKLASAVVGNSSSGIIEAPFARAPTVNIGQRQAGRPQAASIIDCVDESQAIEKALRKALDPAFRQEWPEQLSLFGDGYTADRIVAALREMNLSEDSLLKRFFDIDTPTASTK